MKKKDTLSLKKRLRRVLLSAAALSCAVLLGAAPAEAGTFNIPLLDSYSRTQNADQNGYLFYQSQGFAIDTYNGRDFYSITLNSAGKGTKFSKALLTETAPDGYGYMKVVRELVYDTKQLGHANDATVYQSGSHKYLFVAVSGGEKVSTKSTTGKKQDLAAIDLDAFQNGQAKVLPVVCKFSLGDFTPKGVTYCGQEKIKGKKQDIFVVKNGETLIKCTLSATKDGFALNSAGSCRHPMPELKDKSRLGGQDITYHRGYIYLTYSGAPEYGNEQYLVVSRVKMKGSFVEGKQTQVKADHFIKKVTSLDGLNFTMVEAEGTGFQSLEKACPMYIMTNRAGGSGTGFFVSQNKF